MSLKLLNSFSFSRHLVDKKVISSRSICLSLSSKQCRGASTLAATSNPQSPLLSSMNIIKPVFSRMDDQRRSFSSSDGNPFELPRSKPHINNPYNNHNMPPTADSFNSEGKPTIEYAKSMKTSFTSMSNMDIIHLASEGDPMANREVLTRHIMSVDNIEYDEAAKIFTKIREVHRGNVILHFAPYHLGLVVSLAGAAASFPLVFEYNTVMAFNDGWVTMDIPEPKDLETWLEVGAFSWNWMEPILGQVSFVLLCLQFARAQFLNLGLRPYGKLVRDLRVKRLIKHFPQYDPRILSNYSITDPYYYDN